MKWCVMVLMLILPTAVSAAQCEALKSHGLSTDQVGVVYRSYVAGAPRDMSYSLAAIAWKESSAGRYLINLQDPSAGVFMVSVVNALSYLKWEDTPFNRNRVAQMLMEDFGLAAEFAQLNLQFWKDQYGENWRKIYASYNAGYNIRAGKKYSDDIVEKIKVIAKCGWKVK